MISQNSDEKIQFLSFFAERFKPAVKSLPAKIPNSLEPHFVNVSPFGHHLSPFLTILLPLCHHDYYYFSPNSFEFSFHTSVTASHLCPGAPRVCSRSDSKPPLSNHVANCAALQLKKLQNWPK